MNIATMLEKAAGLVWGPATILLLLFCGIYFTVRTGFFQFFCFGKILRNTFGKMFSKAPSKAGISPFAALSTALAGTVGVGNIVGISLAIAAGGPGVCFWMCVSALFGMMTKFAEVFLAMTYRSSGPSGGGGSAVSFLLRGVNSPRLSHVYAALGLLTSFGLGCAVQANALTGALSSAFSVSKVAVSIAAALFTALLLWGGIRFIAAFSTVAMPVISLLYIGCALLVIGANFCALPHVLAEIFTQAFTVRAAAGGGLFAAIRYGFARGVFSNEAGLGTSCPAHCATSETQPAAQALWGIVEVFLDTIVICMLTALALLTAGTNSMFDAAESVLGGAGSSIVTVSVAFFALATIVAWSFYGSVYFSFLFRGRGALLYRLLFCAAVAAGGVFSSEAVWFASDIFNGLIIFPNVAGLLILSSEVVKGTKKYRKTL